MQKPGGTCGRNRAVLVGAVLTAVFFVLLRSHQGLYARVSAENDIRTSINEQAHSNPQANVSLALPVVSTHPPASTQSAAPQAATPSVALITPPSPSISQPSLVEQNTATNTNTTTTTTSASTSSGVISTPTQIAQTSNSANVSDAASPAPRPPTFSFSKVLPANLTAGVFSSNETIPRAFKYVVGDKLQSAMHVAQHEYQYYMNRHRYGREHMDPEFYNKPAPGRDFHYGKCLRHEPGMVRIKGVPYRGYCFGTAHIKGPRVCDARWPNYMKMAVGGTGIGEQRIHGMRFAVKAFHYRSEVAMRGGADYDGAVHVVSQGTLDRLPHLQNLLTVWHGPVSFAALLDSRDQLKDLDSAVHQSELLQRYVDIHVAWRVGHRASDPTAFYPINMLRNMALQVQPRGRHVFVLDIDVVPSAPMALYRDVVMAADKVAARLPGMARRIECPGLRAYVPPAMNMGSEGLQQLHVHRDPTRGIPKQAMVEAMMAGAATPMHLYFAPAYGPTDHYEWLKSDNVEEVPYLTRFEPYYIATTPLPLFNESFVDRGGNKAQQAMEMAAAGYRFYRLPHVFVVDVPHARDEQGDEEETEGDEGEATSHVTNNINNNSAVHFNNPTAQKGFKKFFIREQWATFFDYLPHRYRFNLPSPQSNDAAFRQYRRVYQRLAALLWGTMGARETDS